MNNLGKIFSTALLFLSLLATGTFAEPQKKGDQKPPPKEPAVIDNPGKGKKDNNENRGNKGQDKDDKNKDKGKKGN